jgi:hypothetical protein
MTTTQHKRVIRKPKGQTKEPNKYGAEAFYYDPIKQVITAERVNERDIFFASKLEFRVWMKLCSLLDLRQISRQSPLRIKHQTGIYPAMFWRCDFRVWELHNPANFLNIEAKGLALPEFKNTLQHLECVSPSDWRNLVVVSDRETKIDSCVTTVLINQLPDILKVHKII